MARDSSPNPKIAVNPVKEKALQEKGNTEKTLLSLQ
jgi:hypothetical protein